MIERGAPRLARGQKPRVLCVDDEPAILHVVRRILESHGYDPTPCPDPLAALAVFDGADFDLVVTDVHMPGLNGLALMQALRERDPELPVVVVTGHGTVDTAIQALRRGAAGMLLKPFTAEELLGEVEHALGSARIRRDALEYRYINPVLDSIALTLSTAIEARHLETGEHCRQIGLLSERIAAVLGLEERAQMTVRIGGYLHDIGKIGIADAILLKPGRLTDLETTEMRRHSEIGAAILEVHEVMAPIAELVRHHHERWDGRGYPSGRQRTETPIGARIIAVADAYNAMTSSRVYRAALPVERAWAELHAHSGSQFDPAIIDAFASVVDGDGRLLPIGQPPDAIESLPPVIPGAPDWRRELESRLPDGSAGAAATTSEPCAVAPSGQDCGVVASGEGCEIVRPPSAEAGLAPG